MNDLRGSPAYWQTVQYDVLAMIRQLGIPTWFLTLSAADMKWPDVIQHIANQYETHLTEEDVVNMTWEDKCKWLSSNPVTAARHFQYRLDMFFKEFLCCKPHPIGEIIDFVIRIEFQARGSPHAHIIIWVKDAPTLEINGKEAVAEFIDKYQSCHIPEAEGKLKDMVLSLLKHKHSSTCRKHGACRFKFPRMPSENTIIASEPEDPESKKQKLLHATQVLGSEANPV